LVALGDNGTGKSTIADALEFFFTGQIRFLAREGRAIVQHQSADPDEAVVEIETTGTLGGRATRSDFVPAARAAATRESFLLSGRTLAEFVDKTKNEKWKYLFEILGLETVDQLRRDLQQARNSLEGDRSRAHGARESAVLALRGRCSEVTETGLFTAIKSVSRQAGVEPPSSLDAALQQDWAAAMSVRRRAVRLAAEFQMVIELIASPPSVPSVALLKAWNRTVSRIHGAASSRVRLLEAAQTHLEHTEGLQACPVCGQTIEDAILRKRVSDALQELRSSSQALQSARRTLVKFINGLNSTMQHRRAIIQRASRLGIQLPAIPVGLETMLSQAKERATQVDLDGVETEVRRLKDWDTVAAKLTREAAPTVTPQDADVVNLVLLVDHGRNWLQAEAALRHADRALDLASRMYEGYEARMNAFLTAVLSGISGRVASIYGRLHPEESVQNISVETWGEKGVELAVEFHGTRQRPPHGVLSESHLNSLGIALFLAMAETFNEHLHFIVLDDVVNSLDVEHRGRLAEFLVSEYQDRQLIVLTHDRLLYERLRSRAPQWRSVEFTSWTYEEGPRLSGYDVGGFLDKAFSALDAGDLQGAASKGRRALEELLQEACEGIRANLPFYRGHRNDRREIGELLRGVRRALRDNRASTPEISELLSKVEADLRAALNVEAHAASEWASATEMMDALDHIKALAAEWTCGACATRTWARGEPPATHCRCGSTTFSRPATP
jgi:hypothetical protein